MDSTGLYYYGARYYDPTIGRFISPDSIVPDPFNSQAFNRYSYVLNNPLKYTDPSGHNFFECHIGITIKIFDWLNINPNIGTIGTEYEVAFTQTETVATSRGDWGFVDASLDVGFSLNFWSDQTTLEQIEGLAEVKGLNLIYATLFHVSGDDYDGWGMDLSLGFSIPGPRSEIRETKLIASDSSLLPIEQQSNVTQSTSNKFTASSDQLNYWSDYYPGYYENLVDYSYNSVASGLGEGQMVGWSSSQGYYAVDTGSYDYSWDYWY